MVEISYRFIGRYPLYRFGSDGSVWYWKLKRKYWKELRWLFQKSRPGSYPRVYLTNEYTGKRENKPVHAVISEAFLGVRPEGMVCRHLDGDKNNASANNLAYGTHVDNEWDKDRHGRRLRGSKHHQAKLTDVEVLKILESTESGVSLARRYRVTPTQICAIRKGRSWKHVQAQMFGPRS